MTPTALVIAALLTIGVANGQPVYAPHLARHPMGVEARSEQIGFYIDTAAEVVGVKANELTSLLYYESTLSFKARSGVGAEGIGQLLNPVYKRPWRQACRAGEKACEMAGVHYAAIALKDSLTLCKTFPKAVFNYRHGRGRCSHANGKVRRRDFVVVRLSLMVAERLNHPSTKRLQAPRMP